MSAKATDDVEHLKSFHCLQVTIEFAQNLISTDRQGVYAKLVLFNADNSVKHSLRSEVVADVGNTPTFDSRMLLPYSAQRRLQFAVWGVPSTSHMSEDYEIGQYTLDLSPFNDRKKSLAAKMKLKNRDLKEVGHLNVRVKMSSQVVTQAFVTKYLPKKAAESTNMISSNRNMRAIHILLLDGSGFPNIERHLDPFVRVTLGREVLKSDVKRNAGTSATFNCLFSLPYNQESSFGLELWDQEMLHTDRQLASKFVDLQSILSGDRYSVVHDVTVRLEGKESSDAGSLRLRFGLSSEKLLSSSVENDVTLKAFPIEGPAEFGQLTDNNKSSKHSNHGPASNETQPQSPFPRDFDSDDLNSDDEVWNEVFYGNARLSKDVFKGIGLKCYVYLIRPSPHVNKFSAIAPYITVRLGNQKVSTNAVRNSDSEIDFNVVCSFPHNEERFIIFEVYDRQHDGNIHLLGRRQVDMSEFYFRRGNIFEGTVELFPFGESPPGSQRNGTLSFRLQKTSTAVKAAKLELIG